MKAKLLAALIGGARLGPLVPLLLAPLHAAEAPPQWLHEIASAKTRSYAAKVPAVVLFNEERVTVEENGRVQTSDAML